MMVTAESWVFQEDVCSELWVEGRVSHSEKAIPKQIGKGSGQTVLQGVHTGGQ